MPHHSITVKLDQRLGVVFAGVGAALGLGVAFGVGPAVEWLLARVGGAPALLRLISELPLPWAVGLLTVAGLLAGWLIFGAWSDEVSEVTVSPEELRIKSGGQHRFSRAR